VFVGPGLSASGRLFLYSPSHVSGSTSVRALIAATWWTTFLWACVLRSELYGSSPSCMTVRLRLPLLLAVLWDACFRSVSCSPCLLHLKTQVPKLARGTEACVTHVSGSDSRKSAQCIQYIRPVFFVLLPLLVVLHEVASSPEAADHSAWWPSERCQSSLSPDPLSEGSGGGPRLSRRANVISPGGGLLSSVLFLR